MAVVDSLLRLISSQRAEGLSISSDATPVLLFGAEERPLSMPPIPIATVESFAREVVGAAADDATTEAGPIECRYTTGNGDEFDARVEREDGALRLVFHPAGATDTATQQEPPATRLGPARSDEQQSAGPTDQTECE